MPFKSEAQRKWMWANDPEMAKEWEEHTPKGTKLPKRVKKAYLTGIAQALSHFGFKVASEEIRLQLPRREYHGFESSFRKEEKRNTKKAEEDAPIIADLITHLEHIDGIPAADDNAVVDNDDKQPLWTRPTEPTGNSVGSRLSGVRPAQDPGRFL